MKTTTSLKTVSQVKNVVFEAMYVGVTFPRGGSFDEFQENFTNYFECCEDVFHVNAKAWPNKSTLRAWYDEAAAMYATGSISESVHLMNPHTGSVQTETEWADEGFSKENAELIEVKKDKSGDWVEA